MLIEHLVQREQMGLEALRHRPVMADPRSMIADRLGEIDTLRERSRRVLSHQLDRAADDIDHHRARARALSPLATLKRGYAVLQDSHGHVLTSITQAAAGDQVSVRVADGRLYADVQTIEQVQESKEMADGD